MTDHPYPAVTVTRLTGDEAFQSDGDTAAFTVLSFWQWAASDLTSNLLRGLLADAQQEKANLNARDLTQWRFYVVPTTAITRRFGRQKRISLGSLATVAARPVSYGELGAAVSAAARETE